MGGSGGPWRSQAANLKRLGDKFIGVLLDPPYAGHFSSAAPGAKPITVTQLAALNLPQLCPIGFIFIWVDKCVLSDVVYLMERCATALPLRAHSPPIPRPAHH